ncbi:glycosyltransferase family 32 protein [Paenibacillus chartarius]|uniref:Glycosyltransferase family 32 protein n=1 Tax=Paenibacillus chartarius TaxID=747481 RepID=A0ABV6DUY5_9BACL
MELIPKTIHYCWFGGNDKPDIVKKCIGSWERHLSGYRFVEWNESNFDISCNAYVKEAYAARKFAFVSDYARAHALCSQGGIYLDTDVEVFKPFDDLLHHESFWGFEQADFIATSTIGCAPGNRLMKQFVDSYECISFLKEDGSHNDLTNVAMISRILEGHGLLLNGQYQELEGIGAFYPQTYFSPYDYINHRKLITENTYAMHHFHKSWLPPSVRLKSSIKKAAALVIGGDNIARLRKWVTKA